MFCKQEDDIPNLRAVATDVKGLQLGAWETNDKYWYNQPTRSIGSRFRLIAILSMVGRGLTPLKIQAGHSRAERVQSAFLWPWNNHTASAKSHIVLFDALCFPRHSFLILFATE